MATEIDEFDIYGDLEQFDYKEQLRGKEIEVKDLTDKLNSLVEEITKIQNVNQTLEREKRTMLRNMSSLLLTAKNEIQRKDESINQLRKEKDDICFRRMKHIKIEKAQLNQEKSIQTDLIVEPKLNTNVCHLMERINYSPENIDINDECKNRQRYNPFSKRYDRSVIEMNNRNDTEKEYQKYRYNHNRWSHIDRIFEQSNDNNNRNCLVNSRAIKRTLPDLRNEITNDGYYHSKREWENEDYDHYKNKRRRKHNKETRENATFISKENKMNNYDSLNHDFIDDFDEYRRLHNKHVTKDYRHTNKSINFNQNKITNSSDEDIYFLNYDENERFPLSKDDDNLQLEESNHQNSVNQHHINSSINCLAKNKISFENHLIDIQIQEDLDEYCREKVDESILKSISKRQNYTNRISENQCDNNELNSTDSKTNRLSSPIKHSKHKYSRISLKNPQLPEQKMESAFKTIVSSETISNIGQDKHIINSKEIKGTICQNIKSPDQLKLLSIKNNEKNLSNNKVLASDSQAVTTETKIDLLNNSNSTVDCSNNEKALINQLLSPNDAIINLNPNQNDLNSIENLSNHQFISPTDKAESVEDVMNIKKYILDNFANVTPLKNEIFIDDEKVMVTKNNTSRKNPIIKEFASKEITLQKQKCSKTNIQHLKQSSDSNAIQQRSSSNKNLIEKHFSKENKQSYDKNSIDKRSSDNVSKVRRLSNENSTEKDSIDRNFIEKPLSDRLLLQKESVSIRSLLEKPSSNEDTIEKQSSNRNTIKKKLSYETRSPDNVSNKKTSSNIISFDRQKIKENSIKNQFSDVHSIEEKIVDRVSTINQLSNRKSLENQISNQSSIEKQLYEETLSEQKLPSENLIENQSSNSIENRSYNLIHKRSSNKNSKKERSSKVPTETQLFDKNLIKKLPINEHFTKDSSSNDIKQKLSKINDSLNVHSMTASRKENKLKSSKLATRTCEIVSTDDREFDNSGSRLGDHKCIHQATAMDIDFELTVSNMLNNHNRSDSTEKNLLSSDGNSIKKQSSVDNLIGKQPYGQNSIAKVLPHENPIEKQSSNKNSNKKHSSHDISIKNHERNLTKKQLPRRNSIEKETYEESLIETRLTQDIFTEKLPNDDNPIEKQFSNKNSIEKRSFDEISIKIHDNNSTIKGTSDLVEKTMSEKKSNKKRSSNSKSKKRRSNRNSIEKQSHDENFIKSPLLNNVDQRCSKINEPIYLNSLITLNDTPKTIEKSPEKLPNIPVTFENILTADRNVDSNISTMNRLNQQKGIKQETTTMDIDFDLTASLSRNENQPITLLDTVDTPFKNSLNFSNISIDQSRSCSLETPQKSLNSYDSYNPIIEKQCPSYEENIDNDYAHVNIVNVESINDAQNIDNMDCNKLMLYVNNITEELLAPIATITEKLPTKILTNDQMEFSNDKLSNVVLQNNINTVQIKESTVNTATENPLPVNDMLTPNEGDKTSNCTTPIEQQFSSPNPLSNDLNMPRKMFKLGRFSEYYVAKDTAEETTIIINTKKRRKKIR